MTTKIFGNQITSYTIDTEQLSNTATAAFAKTLAPKILYANVASNNYTVLDDAAVNVSGGYIVVTGSEFQSGAQVLIDTESAASVTYVDNTTLRAQVPAKSAASYNLYVVNPDGGVGLKVAGITYSGTPTWVTTSPLSTIASNNIFSGSFSATEATSYANTTILPTGFNLLANGYYYGNVSVGTETTYSFTIRATDNELQDSDKTFSLTATNVAPQYSIEYLVIAGGGAGGGGGPGTIGLGAGGGAGGFLFGTSNVTVAMNYSITIGSGGSASSLNGSNTSVIGPAGSLQVTTIGGGGGGYYAAPASPAQKARNGGSGGGAGSWEPSHFVGLGIEEGSYLAGGTGYAYPGASQQGYPGGATKGGTSYNGAGGGGAGGAGQTGSNGPLAPPGPSIGGIGQYWPYTGPATYYAGGGGGGRYAQDSGSAPGGIGGGGSGGDSGGSPGGNGTFATGGGGGGVGGYAGPTNAFNAGTGGSGVVILAIPTANYPGSAAGATVTTPPAAPGKTVLTYISSGTFTA